MEEIFVKVREYDILGVIFKDQDFVSLSDIISELEEQKYKIKLLEEQIEDLNKSIEEDYKPIDKYDELGISESDFH